MRRFCCGLAAARRAAAEPRPDDDPPPAAEEPVEPPPDGPDPPPPAEDPPPPLALVPPGRCGAETPGAEGVETCGVETCGVETCGTDGADGTDGAEGTDGVGTETSGADGSCDGGCSCGSEGVDVEPTLSPSAVPAAAATVSATAVTKTSHRRAVLETLITPCPRRRAFGTGVIPVAGALYSPGGDRRDAGGDCDRTGIARRTHRFVQEQRPERDPDHDARLTYRGHGSGRGEAERGERESVRSDHADAGERRARAKRRA